MTIAGAIVARLVGGLFAVLMAASVAIAGEQTYVVGVEDLDYSPVYAVENGVYVGAGRDILDAFAADQGFRFIYRPLPVRRLFAELIRNGIDFKFPDNPHWQVAAKAGTSIAYSRPMIAYIDGTLVPKAAAGRGIERVAQLGTVRGFTPFAWAQRLAAGRPQLREGARLDNLLASLEGGRLDAIYANVAVALSKLERQGRGGAVVFDPALPHDIGAYMLSTPRHPEIVARFDAWMIANAERVRRIKASWQAERRN